MDTEETKAKRDNAGCSCFKDTPLDFGKMTEMMRKCCDSQDGSIDCSITGKKMMTAIMEMCCGSKGANAKQGSENNKS